MNQEQQVTVRIQKVKRTRIRMKLIVFAGYFYAGYWYHDDGDCRIIVSGVGSPASGGRVGKHDEQRQEHAADLSMDRIISGIGHLCISCDI